MDRRQTQITKLSIMIVLTFIFFLTELIYGHLTGSLALIGDSYHMISDFIALIVGLSCVSISDKTSSQNTFGWVRAEILGALVNSVFLAALCFTILIEAIERLVRPSRIEEPATLLVVGGIGLGVNLVGLLLFYNEAHVHGHGHGKAGTNISSETTTTTSQMMVDSMRTTPSMSYEPSKLSTPSDDNLRILDLSHKTAGVTPPNLSRPDASYSSNMSSNRQNSRPPRVRISEPRLDNVLTINWMASANQAGVEFCEKESFSHYNQGDCDTSMRPYMEIQKNIHENGGGKYSTKTVLKVSKSSKSDSYRNVNFNSKKDGHGHDQMNIRGVFLHILGDALGSVGVMVSALLTIYKEDEPWIPYVDPILSMILVAIILSTTFPLLKQSSLILLQHVPGHIRVESLHERLSTEIQGVLEIHELHIWQLVGKKLIGSVHVKLRSMDDYERVLKEMKKIFHKEGIHSSTIQPEFVGEVKEEEIGICRMECRASCEKERCCKPSLKLEEIKK